jgi:hypothetical protein
MSIRFCDTEGGSSPAVSGPSSSHILIAKVQEHVQADHSMHWLGTQAVVSEHPTLFTTSSPCAAVMKVITLGRLLPSRAHGAGGDTAAALYAASRNWSAVAGLRKPYGQVPFGMEASLPVTPSGS